MSELARVIPQIQESRTARYLVERLTLYRGRLRDLNRLVLLHWSLIGQGNLQIINTKEESNHLINSLSDGNDWAFNVIEQDGTSCTILLTGSRGALTDLIELLRDPLVYNL